MRQIAPKNIHQEAMNEGDTRDFGEPFRDDKPEFVHGKCRELFEKGCGERKRYEAPDGRIGVRGKDGAGAGAGGGQLGGNLGGS